MKNSEVVAKQITITIWQCKCERCEHKWESRKASKPKCCPSCKSPYWETKATRSNKKKEI